MIVLHKVRLNQGEFLAVVTCESEKVSVLLLLCFEGCLQTGYTTVQA